MFQEGNQCEQWQLKKLTAKTCRHRCTLVCSIIHSAQPRPGSVSRRSFLCSHSHSVYRIAGKQTVVWFTNRRGKKYSYQKKKKLDTSDSNDLFVRLVKQVCLCRIASCFCARKRRRNLCFSLDRLLISSLCSKRQRWRSPLLSRSYDNRSRARTRKRNVCGFCSGMTIIIFVCPVLAYWFNQEVLMFVSKLQEKLLALHRGRILSWVSLLLFICKIKDFSVDST